MSNTLCLSDEILMQVEKPARYTGGELNMVKKEPSDVAEGLCLLVHRDRAAGLHVACGVVAGPAPCQDGA